MVEAKPEVVTGLTVKAFIVGLIGCIFTAFVNARDQGYAIFLLSDVFDYWNANFRGIGVIGSAFAFMMILAIINYGAQAGWWKFRFSRQEVGVIVIFTMLGAYLQSSSYQEFFREWFAEGIYVAKQSPAKQKDMWAKFPDTLAFGPKSPEPYAALIKEGYRTLAIDWGAFMPEIFAGVLWCVSAILFYVFGSLLLRRLYTRVEYLPMPFTEVMGGFIDLTQPASKKVRFFTEKPFLIGFLLSFVYHFAVQGLYPWITLATGIQMSPQIGTFPPGGVYLYPAWDITKTVLLPWSGVFITLAPRESELYHPTL